MCRLGTRIGIVGEIGGGEGGREARDRPVLGPTAQSIVKTRTLQ